MPNQRYKLMFNSMLKVSSILVLVFVLGGCSGSEKTAAVDRFSSDEVADATRFEDFDDSKYADEPPSVALDVVHNVPESIMNSTAGREARTVRSVQGFRLQIHSSLDKSAAVEKEEFARDWWRSIPVEERPVPSFGNELPSYLRYVAPYYRVRVGNFEIRADAEAALVHIRKMFPEAFIAIDTVTIVR